MAKEADPRAEWSALASELARAPLRAAYILRGAESWLRGRALELVLDKARTAELELCRHDAKDPEFRLQMLLDDCTSEAMFAPARCIVLQEPDTLLRKNSDGEESATVRALRAFVRGRRGTLVLVADSLRSDLAIVKELLALGATLHSFRRLYERPGPWVRDSDPRRGELCTWLVAHARERGIALSADQALLLIHAHGNDLAALDSQLTEIAAGGAQALARIASTGAGSPWETADALLAGDVARAVLAIETLFRGGKAKDDGGRETNAGALVAMTLGGLRSKVRAGVAYAHAIERGLDGAAAQEEAGIGGNDQALKGALPWRSARDWRRMLDDVLEVERATRRGASVDAGDFARLALRWSRRDAVRSG